LSLRFGIVGAGMAGLACAEALRTRDRRPVLLDKGRGAGGRMAARRMATPVGQASFDMGAQYFTARDPGFTRRVDSWIDAGLVAPWGDAGADAYVGVPSMNAPIRQMAEAQAVRWATRVVRIERVRDEWQLCTEAGERIEVDVAIIALPAEQAAQLLVPIATDFAERARSTTTAPCWTAMLTFSEPVAVIGNCFRGSGTLSWAARNNSKPGRSGPESWILQGGPEWSDKYLAADPHWVVATLVEAAASLLGAPLPASCAQSCHRWRYARSGTEGSGALWDPHRRLGVCGDWLFGPRIEAAWRSGNLLAKRIEEDAERGLLVS